MRRSLAILAGLVLLVGLPATASAGKATKFTDHAVSISCDGPATSGGGFVFFGASASSQFGPDAFVDYWVGTEPSGDPDLFRDFDSTPTVTWNGTTLAGSMPLLDSSGDPAGSATFSATLTPAGDPFPFDDRFREGNSWHQFTGTSQPMDPSGSLTIGSSTFSLGTCFADETTVTVFETNPKTRVNRFSERSVGCDLTNTRGDTAFLFTNLDVNDTFVDATVFPASGAAIGAFGSGTLVNGVLDTALDTYDPETGEPSSASASIHLVIAGTGDRFDVLLRDGPARFSSRGVTLDIEGSFTVAGITFDLGPCIGIDGRSKEIFHQPSGPKPGGKVPSNDLPSGATTLRAGSRTSVATKGASPDREASYECLVFEEPDGVFEAPVGFTVWYRIVGTGGSITVDTAGSDYDTVAAVYTSNGSGGFTPVPNACVDDVPTVPVGRTLQAAVTWPTVAGTTYYVKIGGFPSAFPYGNLKVAVR